MSDAWAMNAGKGSTALGTATITAADETFTLAAHGLGDGDTVTVDTLTGGAVGVLVVDAVYFVRDVTTNTFTLSLSLHGPVVEFASDGGADVYHFAPQYTAAELRRLDAGLMFGGTADAFGARQGVRPGHVPASVSGTTWTVENLTGAVYPGLSATDGPYRVQHESESGSLDPADGSNDRIDALDLQVLDDDVDASGFRRASVVYVAGTPGSGVAPPVTGASLRLATILVPSGGTPSPSVATLAPFTVASGGVLPVRDDTELPASGLYDGMMAWRQDTHELVVRNTTDSAWVPPVRGWQPIGFDDDASGGEFVIDLTAGGRFPAGTFSMIRLWLRGNMDAGSANLQLRANDDSTAGLHESGLAVRDFASWEPPETLSHVSGNLWNIAQWHTTLCTAEVTIFDTDQSSRLPYLGRGARLSGTPGSQRQSEGSGRLTADRLIDSVRLLIGSPGSAFATLLWRAEGYRK